MTTWIDDDRGQLEEAEAAFIAAARRLDRLRVGLGLEHLSAKDLPTGLGNGGEGGEQGETEGESESDPAHGMPPEWRALMDEARAFEAWYLPSRLGINAWVGVDTMSGLYGGWSADGDTIYDWDEANMMTASGDTPAEVVKDLIGIARSYRERRDAERAEDES